MAGDHKTASIISISWMAFWLGTTRPPASSASAGSRFGWGTRRPASSASAASRFGWRLPDGSIISISWVAFWLGTIRRPASSASAGSRFGWGPPPGQHHQHQLDQVWLRTTRRPASSASAGSRFGSGPPDGQHHQHHQHQLDRVLAEDHQTASIISISWVAFWQGTTRRPASSASAGSRFGWGPPDGQHQKHQLDRVLAGDHQTASIKSISWIAFWLGTTRRPASSASAGLLFGGPPNGQHHQHQLDRVLAGDHQTARSSASAGSRFGWGPPDGQHHQHQLDRVLAGDHQTASIISISWIAFWLETTRRPASSASAGSGFGWGPPDGQHHQHQLGRVCWNRQTASIISISWVAFWLGTTTRPASSASAGSRFGWGPPDGQHHHRVLAGDHKTASIISISWIAFWLGTTRRPASSASAGSRFGWGPPHGQHHQHQLDRVLPGDHQTASIISISWVAFWLGTTRRPASSASAGSRFGWRPPDGQHHQHQLGQVLAGDHQTASIISISWVAVWLGTTRQPASSASAGSRFWLGTARRPPSSASVGSRQTASIIRDHQTASIISISWITFWMGTTRRPASSASAGSRLAGDQHHQHQLGRVLAGDHQTASIISISWVAFWLGTTRRPASSASAGSRFGWGPPHGQHHQHQLDRVLAGDHQTASIISISCVAFWLGTTRRQASSAPAASIISIMSIISISWIASWLGTTRRPASSASAGSRFGWGPPDGQHHQHQLDRVLAGDHKTTSIISISWVAVWLGTTRWPASSPSDGQHHQHELGRFLARDHQTASIISISWIAFWGTAQRPASSASAGSGFGWGPPDGQHHQHQLGRGLAGDHQTASIISISWIAIGSGPPDGQHHQHLLGRVLAGDRQTASIISISWVILVFLLASRAGLLSPGLPWS